MILYNSGWTLKRILRLTVQSINGIPNAKRASGPTPEKVPEFRKFEKVTDLMRLLEKQDLLEFVFESYDDTTQIALALQKSAWDSPEADRLADMLNIFPGQTHYEVVYQSIRPEIKKRRSVIMLESRSLLGVLFFLSHNVKVPEKDLERNIVRETLTDSGEPFDWSRVLHNTFVVRNTRQRPTSAAVAISHGDSWFYIQDSDIESKKTLMLVSQLFDLQSGKGKRVIPILTLPVGR